MINTVPNQGAKATDEYILKGGIEEVYEPHFTYHGFRYVEVTGFPGTPILESIEGCVVHSAVEPTGGFVCSNPLINKIHQNILWGQVSNLMSVPTDCPQRDERMGWMGDAQLTAEEVILNFDMAGFYTKWTLDMKQAQKEDGSLPDVVPPCLSLYPADPAWGTACVIVPWYLYLYYEDKRILEEHYSVIKKWVDFLTSQAKNYILFYDKFGDWCAPSVNKRSGKTTDTPCEVTSTCYYYHDALTLFKIARILGKSEDAEKYSKLAKRIRNAFNREFLEEDRYSGKEYSELYKTVEPLIPPTVPEGKEDEIKKRAAAVGVLSSQTTNLLPLFLDMVPEDKRETVLRNLIDDVAVTHSYHLNAGIVGTRYLFDVLTRYDYADLAYELVTQTTYPSWGYMIKEGATTLWERWEYLVNDEANLNSHNHIMFGSVDTFFYKVLAGIRMDPSYPGFKQIIIKARPVGDLKYASASLKTIRGIVSSGWSRNNDSLNLQVSLPCNTKAKVSIPKLKLKGVTVRESGKVIWQNQASVEQVAGITGGEEGKYFITFEIESGSYSFEPIFGNSRFCFLKKDLIKNKNKMIKFD